MNAPRQGLFASLLIISFAVHVALMIHATDQQLSNTRAIQGELMTRQLAEDSLAMLAPTDTVSLALMANRYTSRPDVAALKIVAADGRVLATSGNAPTRSGEIFNKKVLLDQKPVGQIELTLIEPSIGEMVRDQWLPILLSFLVHGLLWLLYRLVARPTRSEYLRSLAREQQLQQQVQNLHLQLEQVQKNAVLAQALMQSAQHPANRQGAGKPNAKVEETSDSVKPFILKIGFVDPKQLLGTLSPGLARPYFNLCQTLLEQAIQQNRQHFAPEQIECNIVQGFGESGAIVSADANHPQAALFLAQLAELFNLLTEVVYKRHREIKRFALCTCTALAEGKEDQPAQGLAQSLIQHVEANQLAVHLSDEQVLKLQQYFQLSAFEDPTDAQTREALVVTAINVEGAKFISKARERILAGEPAAQKAPQS